MRTPKQNEMNFDVQVVDSNQDLVREGNKIVISKNYRDRLLTEDFSKLMTDAKATPVLENGKVKGFKLSRIKEGSVYAKAGLKDGDVVESINGKSFDSSADAIKALNSIKSSEQ